MKHLAYLISLCLAALALSACSDRDDIFAEGADPQELTDLDARMSRATTVAALREYVGRHQFADKDVAVFTTIKRAINPIGLYTYHDIEFSCTATTDSKGNTSIGWSRIKNKGTTEEGNNEKYPDRIYWTDATNPHTFIGFCVPQQGGGGEFDWKHTEDTPTQPAVYYGSIGDPTADGPIDFSTTGPAPDTISGNVELRKNDILLTYSNSIKADDAIAKLYFHHGLAQVRVIVSISDFAAGGGDDTKSRVSDMTLKNMLMLYKWQQSSSETQYLLSDDQNNLDALYTSPAPKYNQRKDVKLWNPNADGIGEKSSRTFTYYGLAVPREISANPSADPIADPPLAFSFKVTYPNPMHPEEMVTKDYSGSIGSIHFDAGKCTTINIALNHRNEKMTVGAEYDEWDFIDTPDQGELKKKSIYLTSGDMSKVTYHDDPGATVDDATWLYKDGTKVVDLYGNDGTTEGTAYTITTADELLSFAKEVTNGYDFTDQFVRLDANIHLQATISGTDVVWPGIGTSENAFNGTFLGGNRSVKLLSGKPFFTHIGPKGRVDALLLEDVLGVTEGGGAFAALNKGVICASTVTSKASESFNVVGRSETIVYNDAKTGSTVAGSMVGRNEGVVFACHSNGKFSTNAARVGGLVGYNTGALVVSYTSIKATTTSTAQEKIYRGIVGYNDYAPSPLPADKRANEYGSITYCFFDRDIANNVLLADITDQVYGKHTVEMKKSDFIGVTDRYALMSDADKALLETLAKKDYKILVQGSSNEELTTEEKALRDRLLSTLNGTITYIAYHSYLCPKIINDAYDNGGAGTSDQLQFLINHFLSHYYLFKVGDYPQVY